MSGGRTSHAVTSNSFNMQPPSLVDLTVSKICEDFDDGKTLTLTLKSILPHSVFNTLVAEHQRSCMEVWLRYEHYRGKLYCDHCVRLQRSNFWNTSLFKCFQRRRDTVTEPITRAQATKHIGPTQKSKMCKILEQYRCYSCKTVPYFGLKFQCNCVV